MDIITVITKVVQEQQRQLQEQRKTERQQGWVQRLTQKRENMVRRQRDTVSAHEEKTSRLERLLAQKGI